MTSADLSEKARVLLDLHARRPILVLPNVWDPIGARVLASKGYPAVATASAAISSSLGYLDGERITRATMLEIVSRICRGVEVPVSADMESGYATTIGALDETTHALLDAGAVGMNIEDSLEEGGALRPVPEQAERIAKVREAAAGRGIHLVINARIDSFLSDRFSEPGDRIEDAVERAEAYSRAGADCVYPIGPGDEATLRVLRARIALPLNALAAPGAAPLQTMEAVGINRVSFGPFVFRSCLRKFANIADALARNGDYECFGNDMMSSDEAAEFLSPEREKDPSA